MPRSVPIEDQRTATLVVMVTPEEKRELVRAAEERLTTVSSLIRATTVSSKCVANQKCLGARWRRRNASVRRKRNPSASEWPQNNSSE